MGMSSIRSMNWTIGTLEAIRQDRIDAQFEREQVKRDCELIRGCMTQVEYETWWKQTPNDNENYMKAVSAKLIELKQAGMVARGRLDAYQPVYTVGEQ